MRAYELFETNPRKPQITLRHLNRLKNIRRRNQRTHAKNRAVFPVLELHVFNKFWVYPGAVLTTHGHREPVIAHLMKGVEKISVRPGRVAGQDLFSAFRRQGT